MQNNLLKFREAVFSDNSIDAVLVSDPNNIFYISGFTGGTDGELLITPNSAYIITDSRYFIQAKKESPDFMLIGTKADIDNIFSGFDIHALGVEDTYISLRRYNMLLKSYNTQIVEISEKISRIRTQKCEAELKKIKEAVRLADAAFSNIIKELRVGATENEIAAKLECFMRYNGARATSFETIVASGLRSAMPHGTATNKVIEYGDFVVLDFGCIFEGYCSDMTRTVMVGKPSPKQVEVYQIVKEAQNRASQIVKSGVLAKEVDYEARGYIEEMGYGEYFTHSTGHGVGISVHEPMYATKSSGDILIENTIITVEPGIYIEGEFGVRIEDLVLVGSEGPCILTKSTKELIMV